MDAIGRLGEEIKKRQRRPNDVFIPPIVRRLVQTEEEAKVILELPLPSEEIAKKLNVSKEKVDEIIQEKFKMGLIFPTRHGWQLGRSMLQFRETTCSMDPKFDAKVGKEFFELSKAWNDVEVYPDVNKKNISEKTKATRCLPDWLAIKDNPDRIPEEYLPDILERASKMEGTDIFAASWCCCRRWNMKGNEQVCIQIGRSADYAIRRGSGKKITLEQALEICADQEKKGSVHFSVGNMKTIPSGVYGMICNCTKGSCAEIDAPTSKGLPVQIVTSPSRYQAFVNVDKCVACQACVNRCQFGAITLKKYSSTDKAKSWTNPDLCMGCGSCTLICPQGARTLKVVREPNHIPDENDADMSFVIPNTSA
jgi:NAD-dependent dihydropyrimidine dehydrogenase PreA subunit